MRIYNIFFTLYAYATFCDGNTLIPLQFVPLIIRKHVTNMSIRTKEDDSSRLNIRIKIFQDVCLQKYLTIFVMCKYPLIGKM